MNRMKKALTFVFSTIFAVSAPLPCIAQGWGDSGDDAEVIIIPTLVSELSLYLPADLAAGILRPNAGAGALPAQGNTRAPAPASGSGQGSRQGSGAGSAPGQGQEMFARDAKLYFTKKQIDKLLPILQELLDKPETQATKGKKFRSDINGILTKAQKAEWTRYAEQARQGNMMIRRQGEEAQGLADGQNPGAGRGAASGAVQGGTLPNLSDLRNMNGDELEKLLKSLPQERRAQVEERLRQGSIAQEDQASRERRLLTGLIKAMKEFGKTLK
jgi:hypothetical protein